MSRNPFLQHLIKELRKKHTPIERIVLPPGWLSQFLVACFIGTNLLVWAVLASGTPLWLYWSGISGLWGGIFFAAFLIAEIQESILSQFQLCFLAIVALFSGVVIGKWAGGTPLVFELSGLAFQMIASWGLLTVFKQEMWSSRSFWTSNIVLMALFMFALATSTASFNTISRSEALRFAIPAMVGFTYVWLCPPSVFHLQRDVFYQLLTLILAAGLGIGCVIGFTNPLVALAVIGSLLFLGVTRFSIE